MAERTGMIIFILWYIAIAYNYAVDHCGRSRKGTPKSKLSELSCICSDDEEVEDSVSIGETHTISEVSSVHEQIEGIKKDNTPIKSFEEVNKPIKSYEEVNKSIKSNEGVNQSIKSYEGVNQSIKSYEGVNQTIKSYEGVNKSIKSYEGVNQSIKSVEGVNKAPEYVEKVGQNDTVKDSVKDVYDLAREVLQKEGSFDEFAVEEEFAEEIY